VFVTMSFCKLRHCIGIHIPVSGCGRNVVWKWWDHLPNFMTSDCCDIGNPVSGLANVPYYSFSGTHILKLYGSHQPPHVILG
jgi:hypothetical protein